VVHDPAGPATDLPAVRGLVAQVDELLIVGNGTPVSEATARHLSEHRVRSVEFPANRGTAAAWNAAVAWATTAGHRWLYILDQDSIPSPDAVATAVGEMGRQSVAAVVQPVFADRLRLLPFPWNTVASGSLYDVAVLRALGGFDERLFVDEVDHELVARLLETGHGVRQLPHATIEHQVGSPRSVTAFALRGVVLGHGPKRHRLRGYSTGMLIRRFLHRNPSLSARLALREVVMGCKEMVSGDGKSARALAGGLVTGLATGRPPPLAASRACPYCEGPLLGRFAAVADWRFGAGRPADVYQCAECGALAAGEVPGDEELASWYAEYYTHALEPDRPRLWSRLWPTPRRRREMTQLRSYFSARGSGRLLDVGTGAGDRLVQFADAGWEVVGQDLDPKAGHLAKGRGIAVHHCSVEELIEREEPFDLIGLTHVLEHATDQAALLRSCMAMLAPGGTLCVVAPNAGSLGCLLFGRWWFGLEQPRHLAIPTVESMQRLAGRLGLRTATTATAPTNAAVILGGSLARPLYRRLPQGRWHRVARFATACLGQALGRAAYRLDRRRGEELVWVGGRCDP
jgi:2-polyprenyl-3-methyl-5-hydroxy-6-metoxy-1,4-benzoquinol methylase